MLLLPDFQLKSVNISTILTDELKMCVYIWRHVSCYGLEYINISWVESSVNKKYVWIVGSSTTVCNRRHTTFETIFQTQKMSDGGEG